MADVDLLGKNLNTKIRHDQIDYQNQKSEPKGEIEIDE